MKPVMKGFLLALLVVMPSCITDKNPIKIDIETKESSWEKISDSYPITLYTSPNDIFYAAGDGISKSTDGAKTWINLNPIGYIEVLGVNDGNLYTGGFFGFCGWIQFSTDDGVTWQSPSSFPVNPFTRTFAFLSDNSIFPGSARSDETTGGIYYSKDGGNTRKSTNLRSSVSVWTMVTNSKDYLIAGTTELSDTIYYTGIHKSVDSGHIWTFHSLPGLNTTYIRCLHIDSLDNLYAGTRGNGLYISTNNGKNWTFKGLGGYEIYDIKTSFSDAIFAAGYNYQSKERSVFFSTDLGETWNRLNEGLPQSIIRCLAIDSGDYLYASIEGNGIFGQNCQ